MVAALLAGLTVLAAGLAEGLHARRSRRIALLAFGPSGLMQPWAHAAPLVRVAALALLVWGLATLVSIAPKEASSKEPGDKEWRHLVIILDVSPSMKLQDAGQGRSQTRCARAADLLRSVLERIPDARLRVSIIAVYNGAKRVVTDTKDMAVVDNIINDLPIAQAFDIGKTLLIDGVREAAAVAQDWPRGSATVLIVTDGDTVPDSGMPELPASVGQVLILGVGDPRSGSFIDGHQSFQDASTLRQLAARLRGIYHDGNEKHVPTPVLSALARVIPLRERAGRGMRELAMTAIGVGAGLLATLPVLLAIAGVPAAVPVPTVNQQRMRRPA